MGSEMSVVPWWIRERPAKVTVTITGPDGSVQEFTAEQPAKTEVELDTGIALADLRPAAGTPWGIEPPPKQKLTVVITLDGKRPLAASARTPAPLTVWVIETHSGHGENAAVMGVYASEAAACSALEKQPNMCVCRRKVHGREVLGGVPVDEGNHPHIWATIEPMRIEGA